jgi:hypothetical protein
MRKRKDKKGKKKRMHHMFLYGTEIMDRMDGVEVDTQLSRSKDQFSTTTAANSFTVFIDSRCNKISLRVRMIVTLACCIMTMYTQVLSNTRNATAR